MMARSTASLSRFLCHITGTVFIVSVALLAILIGSFPQKELDWEGTILPLAREYANVSTSPSPHAAQPLHGKVIAVTGCTSGIGLALTRAFSRLGATIIGIGRSEQKLARVKQELPPGTFHSVFADLNDLETVAKAADDIVRQWEHVDILINNAGLHDMLSNMWGNLVSVQGYDRVFAVNYLSHFLLTEKLSATLHNATKPTVLQLSSSAHWLVDGSELIAVPQNEKDDPLPVAARPGGAHGYIAFRSQKSYGNSKLAQIYHVRALRRRHPLLSSSKVRLVSTCPAWVSTNIGGEDGTLAHWLLQVAFPMDGWGIASSLMAILDNNSDPLTHQTEGSLLSVSSDWYINTKVFLVLNVLPSRFYAIVWREALVSQMATMAIWVQRFGAFAGPASSSRESYDDQIADSLYDWSYKAIEKYL